MNNQASGPAQVDPQRDTSKEPGVHQSSVREADGSGKMSKSGTPVSVVIFHSFNLSSIWWHLCFSVSCLDYGKRKSREIAASKTRLRSCHCMHSGQLCNLKFRDRTQSSGLTKYPGDSRVQHLRSLRRFSSRSGGSISAIVLKKDNLAIEIDAPELDKQLMRAVAGYKARPKRKFNTKEIAQADLAQSVSSHREHDKAAVKRLEEQIKFSHMQSTPFSCPGC